MVKSVPALVARFGSLLEGYPETGHCLSWAVSSGRGRDTHAMSKLNPTRTKSPLCHTCLPSAPADRRSRRRMREGGHSQLAGHRAPALGPAPGRGKLVRKLFSGFGKRLWSPEENGRATGHSFCVSHSSTFPSGRGRPPGAADVEGEGGLGAFSSGCSHDSSSVPLRCSEGRGPRHSEPHMVANGWPFLKAGLDVSVRDRGLVWDLCPV